MLKKFALAAALAGSALMSFGTAQAMNHGGHNHSHGVMVKDPWVREAPPTSKVSAAYMVIENHGDKPRFLVAGKCADFDKVEIHNVIMQDGMMRMVEQEKIKIAPNGSLILKPKSYHVMLIGKKKVLKKGDMVDITLVFQNGEEKKITAPVKKMMGGMMMNHGKMDHGKMGH